MGLSEKLQAPSRTEEIQEALAAYYCSCVHLEQEISKLDKNLWMTDEEKAEKKKKFQDRINENYKAMNRLREELKELK